MIIVLSEESVEIIKQLAKIDLEINLKFRPLYFHVEYKRSGKDLELDDFDRFYYSPSIQYPSHSGFGYQVYGEFRKE